MPRGKSKTHADYVKSDIKTGDVIELRTRGFTYTEIAAKLGCSKTNVGYHVKKAMAEQRASNLESMEHHQEVVRRRYEKMWRTVDDLLEAGDIAAVDRGVKVLDGIRKLYGLDALPTTEKGESFLDRLAGLVRKSESDDG